MAAAGDVSVTQNGGQGNAKLHPYLVTLVRWCVSCLWGTATVILHRIITTPLPSITAKPSPRASPKPRPAGTDHLHPEPRVECVVLHQPETPTLDVIFVHGLYGSLSNTWRQGDWTAKYKCGPNKVPLRNETYKQTNGCNVQYDTNLNETKFILNQMTIKKILPNEDEFTTERFYKNSLLKQMDAIENYESQAKFVEDMFKSDFKRDESVVCGGDPTNACICDSCDVGCGCVCDKCYSDCWPKDWIQRDFPGARVISINYTSDPYLWRPLWVKEIKRLRLHERADQMIRQLLDLGVGSRPIVWVGHSKGGLFIKQIYCEAYEAYIALHGDTEVEGQTLNADIEQQSHPNDVDTNAVEINDPPFKVDGVTLSSKASLWELSAGFMFYSVPHRGSPLADFKTPITARSIELLEISKDCALVVSLHERWLRATRGGPVVASLVETGRTLMAVLWLRIVSVDSADAGIGSLSGVCVDHREICKPSSRSCQLYTELTDLIRAALEKMEKRESLSDS